MATTTTILLSSIPGLLPKTKTFSIPTAATTADLLDVLQSLLPAHFNHDLVLTTTSNKQILPSTTKTIHDLVHENSQAEASKQHGPSILPLRLTTPLCGGKGGFGSQLRAAGGRMSSRKKRSQAEAGASNRNLDGRRLRTVTEAKNLATYLAIKPEMDRKEKEERRKRWEQVVEAAEKRENDMRSGRAGKGLSEEWIADKEEMGEKVNDAVKRALQRAQQAPKVDVDADSGEASGGSEDASGSESDVEIDDKYKMVLDEDDMSRLRKEADLGDVDARWVLKNQVRPRISARPMPKRFVGFDDDEEFMSDDSDDKSLEMTVKGKQKAVT